jgi:DinB superfamily
VRPAGRRAAPKRGAKRKKAVRRAARQARATGTKVRRSTVKPSRSKVANSRRARATKARDAQKRANPKSVVGAAQTPTARARARRRPSPILVPLPRRKTTPTARAKAVVARAKKPAPPFPATKNASAKQRLILDLVRARVAVQGALQGLQPPTVEQRPASGSWTVRDHALHLCHWDAEVSRALESALHGIPPSWADFAADETDQFNHSGVEGLRQLSWDDVRRLLLSSRMALMEALESISEESDQPWQPSHPFGAMLKDLADNDRHHADIIKRWRLERGV